MIFLFLIVAGNFPFELKSFLNDAGFTLAYTPCNTNVLDGLGFHPDMQAVVIGGRLICAPEVYDYYKTLGKEHKIPVICGRTALSGNYPKDIAYNIKVVGESVFHNFKYTDSVVCDFLGFKNKIDVSQGYSGCSICKVSDNAIITSDKMIDLKAKENGMDSLLICEGEISLEGFDYGFIGGASFYHDGRVFFFGDIKKHSDYKKIRSFCEHLGTEIVCPDETALSDYGGAIILPCDL